MITTDLLGKASIPDLPYEQPDGSPYRIDSDYFGNSRNPSNPAPGPFASPPADRPRLKVWPD